MLCHGRIKAWEKLLNSFLSGFFVFRNTKRKVDYMNTDWLKVMVAAIFEVLWVIGLKHAGDVWTWFGTIVAIFISFYLMIMAGKRLPIGTVYAGFVGVGTVVTVFFDIGFFGAPFKATILILIVLLLRGVLGMNPATGGASQEGAS